MKKLFLILVICFLGAASSFAQQSDTAWYKTELYFGLNKPKGEVVTELEWKRFCDEYITPCFVEGYTVFYATNCTRDPETLKTNYEKKCIVSAIYKNRPARDYCITQIIKNYKATFKQLSVTRIDTPVEGGFK